MIMVEKIRQMMYFKARQRDLVQLEDLRELCLGPKVHLQHFDICHPWGRRTDNVVPFGWQPPVFLLSRNCCQKICLFSWTSWQVSGHLPVTVTAGEGEAGPSDAACAYLPSPSPEGGRCPFKRASFVCAGWSTLLLWVSAG